MILLGSTGSIGKNALLIAKQNNIKIDVLAAGDNLALLNEQIKDVKPNIVVIKDSNRINEVFKFPKQKVLSGEEGILEALNLSNSNLVLNAIIGFSGLKPSIESIKLNKTLALANKETLAVAGKFINTRNIIPLDSEHFSIQELIKDKNNIGKIIITASGGALRDTPIDNLYNQLPSDVLKHPNWEMGNKITIDSATMVNKLLEVLEAKWLFNTNNIDALIERNSIIHALVQTKDNAIFAHFGMPDMKLSLAHAILGEKAKQKPQIKELDIFKYGFKFEVINKLRYPLWELKEDLINNPDLGVILNAANEILVNEFLNEKIHFGEIQKNIFKVVNAMHSTSIKNIEDVFNLDKEARNYLLAR